MALRLVSFDLTYPPFTEGVSDAKPVQSVPEAARVVFGGAGAVARDNARHLVVLGGALHPAW
jgi:hypothetical protein